MLAVVANGLMAQTIYLLLGCKLLPKLVGIATLNTQGLFSALVRPNTTALVSLATSMGMISAHVSIVTRRKFCLIAAT
jgi:hypothetical protein